MKTARIAAFAVAMVAALGLAACDKDNVGNEWDTSIDTWVDTGTDTGADTTPTDTGMDTTPPDTGVDTGTDTGVDTAPDITTDDAGGTCDRNGFTAAAQGCYDYTTSGRLFQALTGTTPPVDMLSIEFYTGYGDPAPLTGPGTFNIAGTTAEQNYATCGTCVRASITCDTSTCAKTFFATDGLLTLTSYGAVGGQFTGTLTGLTMVEVTINSTTYESTPVPGGEGWCIDSFAFDATVEVGT